ncbi:YcjF family protein [Ferrimonas balearica]|uniref:YcjF family protein n=1 Tax=Ferrimonas balearica TaxID=44012 RepID=UPI001C995B70|nr:TIGR01620 family protein [Ferrimonas balearica]MBY5922158.1 YcjF family protein [Ferrimonas balearica]MBY5994502.1 YcjF family protein [Ferrimonas balearica]
MSGLKPAKEFEAQEAMLTPELKPAQEWEEAAWQDMTPQPSVEPKPRGRRWGTLVVGLLATLALVEAGLTLWDSWQRSPALFALYGVTFAVAGGWLIRGLWREWRRLAQLKRADGLRRTGERLAQSQQQGEAEQVLTELKKTLPVSFDGAWQQFQSQCQPHHSDAEQLKLYELTVLSAQDEQAQACVYRYSAQASLLLAASPMAALDMALMLWRNQAMLDEVARIYGIEPGYWGRIRLVRMILQNLLYAGGSELALDLGTQMLSAELTGKLSARVAQGLGAGLLTARLGYAAMAQCRPLPYNARQRPPLVQVQTRLLKELTRISADALATVRQKAGRGSGPEL